MSHCARGIEVTQEAGMAFNRAAVVGSLLALAMPGLVLTGGPSQAAAAGVQAKFGAGDITTAGNGVVGAFGFTEFPGLPGAGSTLPLGAPFSGVITRIDYRYANAGATGTVGFRIGTGTFTAPYNITVRPATPSGADVQTPVPATAGSALVSASLDWKDPQGAPVGVRINAGERVGIAAVGGGTAAAGTLPTSTGGNILFEAGNQTSGTAAYSPFSNNVELQIQTTLESDQDNDGYGDATQDACPTDATTHGACDTTGPAITIKKHPKKTTSKQRAKFTFSSDDAAATFACKVDKKKFKPCSSPFKLGHVRTGKHKLRIQGTDTRGNVGKAVKFTWTVTR
jgi:hypothetical protein